MNQTRQGIATRCAHTGTRRSVPGGNAPFQPAIVQSTIFDLGTSADAEAIFSGARPGFAYSRFGNPTVELLAEAIAELEGGAGALVTSSGNAAVLCAIVAALEDRTGPLVTHADVYGGSFELAQILAFSGDKSTLQSLDDLSHDPDTEVAQAAVNASRTLKARLP